MSAGAYPYDEALRTAQILARRLARYCEVVRIAGSLRRAHSAGEPRPVGDIEIVAVPKTLERMEQRGIATLRVTVNLLHEYLDSTYQPLVSRGPSGKPYKRWGPRYRRFAAGELAIPCDLFMTTHEAFGAQLAIRTGPAAFSKALVDLRNDIKFDGGRVWRCERFEDVPVSVPTERALFELLELPWIPPHLRSAQALKRVA